MTDELRDSNAPALMSSRPNIPESYGLSAPSAGELLPWDWATERLAASRNYWVATVRPDGRPHVMPVWGLWLDGAFYFGTDPGARKARNLQNDSRAVVHLESGDETVVLEGTMERMVGESDFGRINAAFLSKYEVDMDLGAPEVACFQLAPQVAFGWRETDFPTSATKWVFALRGQGERSE